MVRVGGHVFIDDLKHLAGGNDVQGGELSDPLGVVLGQPVGDPGSPVVAAQQKGIESQGLHDFYLVQGHRPLGVVGVLLVAFGFAAVAVASQVCGHDSEILGKPGSDFVPHDVSLRVPVEQQQGRAAAANYAVNGGSGGLHLALLKTFKHIALPALSSWATFEPARSGTYKLPARRQGPAASPTRQAASPGNYQPCL